MYAFIFYQASKFEGDLERLFILITPLFELLDFCVRLPDVLDNAIGFRDQRGYLIHFPFWARGYDFTALLH